MEREVRDSDEEMEEEMDEEGAERSEGYMDTFEELNRIVASNNLVHDELEYSRDYEENPMGHDCEGDHEERYDDDHEKEGEDDDLEEETDEEDEDEYADDQEHIEIDDEKGKAHLYENKLTKPILKIGNTTVSVGEARLYGLLDKDGNVKLNANKNGKDRSRSKAETKRLMDSLARKKDAKLLQPDAEDEDARECRFKPQRSKEANRAMMNPSCGYDFVSRLDERGGFMERNTKGGESNKAKSEAAKEDYEASLDKLQCPSCRKFQSFDEYVEKRRSCGQCKERYQRLNVVNMNNWKQRQEENERRKRERLKKIEEEFYSDASFAPKLNRSGKMNNKPSLSQRTEMLMEKQKKEAQDIRLAKERQEKEQEEKRRQQAAAAKRNRAAAKNEELEKLKCAGESKAESKDIPKSSSTTSRLNKTAAISNTKKKKQSYNKTSNNISSKFELLLN